VLIIEDNPAELAGLADFVASEGFATSQAASLVEARRILDSVTPDVILCYYLLPDGRGTQLLVELRDRLHLMDFVLVTSSVDEPEVRRREFLPKPVNLGSIQRVLARAQGAFGRKGQADPTKRQADVLPAGSQRRQSGGEQPRTGRVPELKTARFDGLPTSYSCS
jgi:DNA-binding response OmpR family regulator